MTKLQPDNIRGFTLPEMMIVLCIMGVMTLIAVPAFMSLLPEMRLNSSARQVFIAMARARQGAVSQNANACIKFSTTDNSIRAWLDNGPGGARGNYAKDASEPYIFEGFLDDGVIIAFRYPGDTAAFNARGLPVGGGDYLGNYLSYILYLQNSQNKYKGIKISPIGAITIL